MRCRSHQQPREENQEHHRKLRGRVPRHPRRQLRRNRSQLKPNASSHQCRREGVHNRDRKPRPQNSRRRRLLQSRSRLCPRRPPPVWPSLHRQPQVPAGPVGSAASSPASSKTGGPPAIRAARSNGQARSAAATTVGCQGSRASPSAEAGRTCASGRCFKAGGCRSPTEGMPARKKCGGDKWSARLQIGH